MWQPNILYGSSLALCSTTWSASGHLIGGNAIKVGSLLIFWRWHTNLRFGRLVANCDGRWHGYCYDHHRFCPGISLYLIQLVGKHGGIQYRRCELRPLVDRSQGWPFWERTWRVLTERRHILGLVWDLPWFWEWQGRKSALAKEFLLWNCFNAVVVFLRACIEWKSIFSWCQVITWKSKLRQD